MSQDTVRKGITELAAREVDPEAPIDTRLREPGAGPKRLIDKDPELRERLKQMVDPVTRGDPESPLRWTCKSTERLAAEQVGLAGFAADAEFWLFARLITVKRFPTLFNREQIVTTLRFSILSRNSGADFCCHGRDSRNWFNLN
jgi:hypothetical protein